MSLFIVPQSHTDYAWESDGASCLGEACTTDEITPSQLKMILSRGERTLVQMKNSEDKVVGWGCYRIDQLPNLRALHITNLVAHNGGFENFFEEIKKIASAYGCSRVRCSCLPTQAMLFKIKCNFLPVYTTLEIII